MRSGRNVRTLAVAAALVAAGVCGPSVAAAAAMDERPLPGDAEIARAVEQAKADPNLATERTIRTLDWIANPEKKPRSGMPGWLRWIGGLFRWLDQSARLLVYLAAFALIAWLAYLLVRLVGRSRTRELADAGFVAPTHVRDLDIRPETLPADIGAAARALWDRGEPRACLALLYRGLLSRLAHVHRVPIRDSTTEGDCLALASRCLSQERQAYAYRLVSVWQRFVYGHEDSGASTVYALCDEFAARIDPPPASPTFAGERS